MNDINQINQTCWPLSSRRCDGGLGITPEVVCYRGRRSAISVAVAALIVAAVPALAMPTGGQVAAGNVAITQSGNTLTVQQGSQRAVINWQTFGVGGQESVNFVQPNASSVALNRVLGNDASAIYGRLQANGQIFLVNPNGILFGRTAEVNVGGLVASTLNLPDNDFLDGRRTFSGDSKASVKNLGKVQTDAGYVVLLGANVGNEGTLNARLGTVALAAGQQTTLDFVGDKLLSVRVDQGALQAMVSNGELILADGGKVILTARAADQLVSSVVNNSGLIRARTLQSRSGVISLLGDMQSGVVNLSGTLDASATDGGQGGAVETSAARVHVADTARVTTISASGLTGHWLIDPQDYTVAASGGDISGSALSSNLASSSITLQSSSGGAVGSGDLRINDAVQWSANTRLTLLAANSVNVNANIRATGSGAGLTISPNTSNGADGATGAGRFRLGLGATIDLPNVSAAAIGALVIEGTPYTVINGLGSANDLSGATLQGMAGQLGGHYALGSDIDARATAGWHGGRGFMPIGNDTTAFSGTFNGLGHAINGLTVDRPAASNVGLFGWVGSGARVSDVGLVDSSVAGLTAVGALAGWNDGLVRQAFSTGAVAAGASSYEVGGLVGVNAGTADSVHASGTVTGATSVGGLVGFNFGAISGAYAAGSVSGRSGGFNTGGLIGESSGSVANSYATALVSGNSGVGGLVGRNGGTIASSYAAGTVSGSSGVGGLAGVNGGSVSNGYWNTAAAATGVGTGRTTGVFGLSPGQLRSTAGFAGFTFTGAPGGDGWVLVDADASLNNAGGAAGATTPMLAGEYSLNPGNAHQLQLMAMAPAAEYTLSRNIDASATTAALTAVNAQGVATGKDVWSPSGFVPLGNVASPFGGTLDGGSHSISDLAIYLPSRTGVGLIGIASAGTVRNLGLAGGSITGRSDVGGIIGQGSGGSLSNVYSSASIGGSASNGDAVGGLAGRYQGDIVNAYSAGPVSGFSRVGGLVGYRLGGSVDKSYASGAATGAAQVGGLIGFNASGTVANSFWNADANGSGIGLGADTGAIGLTLAQLRAQGNFTAATQANGNLDPGWDFPSTWAQYDGSTTPLLRSFLTPLTVTANNAVKTYDRQSFNGFSVSYSATPDARLLGTLTFGGSASGATQAGSYDIVPGGLYSSQQGYALSFGHGALTINQAPLTVTGTQAASKVYDRTHVAVLSGGNLVGAVAGDDISLNQAGSFASIHVGNGISITATDTLSGAAAANYLLVQPAGLSAAITPKALTVVGAPVAQNKVYDGTTAAVLTGGSLQGVVEGDLVNLVQTGTFADRKVGNNIAVTSTSRLEGSFTGDYSLVQPTGFVADITPKTLVVGSGTVAAGKVYDGTTDATVRGGSIVGVVAGDQVGFSQTGSFADRNAGRAKPVVYVNHLGGTDATNYQLSSTGGISLADIQQKILGVQTSSSANKVYDGNVSADLTANLVGVIGADQVTLAGNFINKRAGTGKTVSYLNALGGGEAANYSLGSARGTTTADILPKVVTVVGSVVSDKVYDGKTKATLTGGSLVGMVAGDKVKLAQAGTFSSKNAGNQIPVVAADLLTGGDAANYLLLQPGQLTGRITPKTLRVSGTLAIGRDYDGTTLVALKNGRISGVVKGDTVNLVQTGQFLDKTAGQNKAVVVSNSLVGADASNYVASTPTTLAKATVKPKLLAVDDTDLVAADKTYDGTTAASVGGSLLDGVLLGDRVVLLQTGHFLSPSIGADKVVIYSNELLGTDAGNYKLPSPAGGRTTAEILEP